MRTASTVLLGVLIAACGSDAPFCSEFVDETGRAVAFCPDTQQDPVCDLPGDEARFVQESDGAFRLVGGERATCDMDFEVVCPLGTVGDAYCVPVPGL